MYMYVCVHAHVIDTHSLSHKYMQIIAKTHNFRHWEFLQLHGFLGLFVVMVWRGPFWEYEEVGGSRGAEGRPEDLYKGKIHRLEHKMWVNYEYPTLYLTVVLLRVQ